jgi:8-oxo-dGTP pyrophosphatase MutT (NUDIX family)
MDGFADRVGFFDIFSHFAAGFVFLLNLLILSLPLISPSEFYSLLPAKLEFLSILIIVILAYIFGIALAPLGVHLGHLLFSADIEHAIDRYKHRRKKSKEETSKWKKLKTLLQIIFKAGIKRAIEHCRLCKKSKEETSKWKKLQPLLEKNFGTNLSPRSYLNVTRAKIKEECPSSTADIDRMNATSIMMRSIATSEIITVIIALNIIIHMRAYYTFYCILIVCSIILFAVLFLQSIKTQRWWVGWIFDTFYAINIASLDSKTLPSNVFRANVGMVVINDEGKVLALERSDVKEAWQLPQGGIKENECPLEAAYRELQEETNLRQRDLKHLAEYPEWLAYELPIEKRSGKYGRGQVQKWYLFRLTGTEKHIKLDREIDQEFISWEWMNLQQLIKQTVSFRRSVYKKLARGFSQYLAK